MKSAIKIFANLATVFVLAVSPVAAFGQTGPMTGEADGGGSYAPAIASSVRVLALRTDGQATYGTGWVIQTADAKNRAGASVVVTARHVVVGAVKVMIVEADSEINDQKPATVISSKVDQDIAFLEVKDLTKPALQLTRARPDVGADIAATGYTTASDRSEAQGRARSATLKRGGVSKFFRGLVDPNAQAPIDQIEFDAPVLAGFSGGPLLNRCGRVVGMTIADGGHVQISEGASVAMAQGVATAVAADEIIRAARAASVDVTAVDTSCGETAALQPPPPPPLSTCPSPFLSVDTNGKACMPMAPTGWQRFTHNLRSPIGIVIGVALLALFVVIGIILWLMSGRRKSSASQVFGPTEGVSTAGHSGSSLLDNRGSRSAGSQAGGSASLRLTGRGPGGEPIDLRFSSADLQSGPVMLGVEGDTNGRIPDTRSKTLVSRKHAQIAYDGRNFTVEDNKSMNRTKVGGETLNAFSKRVLISGDTLTIADVALYVTVE